jgi:predicted nucleic acid-binding protein
VSAVVIEASLAASWCFPDERTSYTEAVLNTISGGAEAIAPRLWAYEIRNCILMGVRRRRITMAHAEAFLEDLKSLPIRLTDPLSSSHVFALADRHGLTVYDAAYLNIAIREGIPLVSLDKALIRAAENLGLPAFQPSGAA